MMIRWLYEAKTRTHQPQSDSVPADLAGCHGPKGKEIYEQAEAQEDVPEGSGGFQA